MSFLPLRLLSVALGSLFIHFSICSAAEIEPVQDDGIVKLIVLTGRIEQGDGELFERTPFTAGQTLVVLFSEGGSLPAALKIGRVIRARRLDTYVPNQAICASACALAWLGGAGRIMGTAAKVGFHAAYTDSFGMKSINSSGNALVGSYLNSLGISDTAIFYFTAAAPEKVLWLTPADFAKLGIHVATYDVPGLWDNETEKRNDRSTSSSVRQDNGFTEHLYPDVPLSPYPAQVVPRKLEPRYPSLGTQSAGTEALQIEVLSFLVAYLRIESADAETALRLMPGSYNEFASYYGTFRSRKEIEADFANYVGRWPVRNYAIRTNSAMVSCLTDKPQCVVNSIIDWEVSSPSRNAKSRGASTWHVAVNREGGTFYITAIDGKVIERNQSRLVDRCVGLSCLLQ